MLTGDVLEQVQKLQSEVADTRAVVSDLETRLNAAEHSNKHIVEELKMLLADAEGTLVGSDDSDSGESEVVSSKHGSGSEDESNIVYNRICHALQTLITEAQSALEKQLEQYERYRRSCDRVSLELEMLLNDTMMDTDYADDYNPLAALFPLLTESPFAQTHPGATATTPTTQPLTTSPEGTIVEVKSQSGLGRTESLKAGSRAERMQRNFQAQFLSPQVHTNRHYSQHYDYQRQQQQHNQYLKFRPVGADNSSMQPLYRPLPRHQQRHFRNQGVGASRSQSLLMQLYGLWKQTWLRRRIMHILTGSLEVGLILWVIFKLGEASLSFMGIQLLKGGPQTWLLYVYGDREGPGSTVAKELYEKIRRDGLRLRQVHLRRAWESEQLLQEAAALGHGHGGVGGQGRTPFSAAGMVWGPVQRMITHAVTGFVLAYLADHAKRLSKKL
ncbi:hypothetical protein BGX23_010820 [Mortierella sp. AD031]|nr:hypothetical protein BGX23_010820 [Mortierella sp. AD031]